MVVPFLFVGLFYLLAQIVDSLTFYRGAAGSKGRTSWTAKPELGDYISVVGFMLYFLTSIIQSSQASKFSLPTMNLELVLAGYSYGSMIVSGLPPIDHIKELFESHPAEASTSSIVSNAMELGRLMIELAVLQKFSERATEPEHHVVDQPKRNVGDRMMIASTYVSYLLISPIFPPVSLFVSTSWLPGTSTDIIILGQKLPAGVTQEQLSSHSTLVIYADNDGFTSSKKIRPWVEKLKGIPDSKFTSCEVVGAGHFWHKPETQQQMRDAIRQWINPSSTSRFTFR
jgi:hypothetical protein